MRFLQVLALAANVVHAVDPLVDLGYAKYQGQVVGNGVNQWLGLRFAAPPTGKLRFAAPQPPLNQTTVQDATKEGDLCVSANNVPGLQYGQARQPMSEDCLYTAVYAPANATADSKLPIMFFIMGGGFSSNSNGNFNGTALVEASGNSMIVVRTNYRVGILGWIAGTAVANDKNGATMNNGLNDMEAALRWTKAHATKFGGNPDHIVLSGDSAGGNAIDLLLTANNGTGFPDLFVGAAAESTGWGADGYIVDRDAEYMRNVNATGCASDPDPLNCMRMLDIVTLQTNTTKDGWGPTFDPTGHWPFAPHYEMMEAGLFQKIPVIYGTASNEGTPDYISNHSATTDADLINHLMQYSPSLTDEQAAAVLKAYPASLNNVSFFGRDVSEASSMNLTLRRATGSGAQWQRDVAIQTEFKLHCVGQWFSDMFAAKGVTSNWHYRYDVLDTTPNGLRDQGIFSPHTSELYAIWGANHTDTNDPKCYTIPASQGGCADAIPIVQHYWISFVKNLDPNKERLAGTPEWKPWTIDGTARIVFGNANATMETVGQAIGETPFAGMNQRQRCVTLAMPVAKAVNANLKKGDKLQPFANGTVKDVTLTAAGVVGVMGNSTSASSKIARTFLA